LQRTQHCNTKNTLCDAFVALQTKSRYVFGIMMVFTVTV